MRLPCFTEDEEFLVYLPRFYSWLPKRFSCGNGQAIHWALVGDNMDHHSGNSLSWVSGKAFTPKSQPPNHLTSVLLCWGDALQGCPDLPSVISHHGTICFHHWGGKWDMMKHYFPKGDSISLTIYNPQIIKYDYLGTGIIFQWLFQLLLNCVHSEAFFHTAVNLPLMHSDWETASG